MERYITSKSTGNRYCDDTCFSVEWPVCSHCGRKMQKWYDAPQGDATYCSTMCLDSEWAICCICGIPTQDWITDKENYKFCSDICYHKHWLICHTCGKEATKGVKDDEGNFYCSESCWEVSLPTCPVCGKSLVHYVENSKNDVCYCSRECLAVAEVKAVATKSTDYFMAGQLYENGVGGLEKDLSLSIEMYKISAAQGYTPAIDKLIELGESTADLDSSGVDSEASFAQVAGNVKAVKETAKLGEVYSRLSYNLEDLETARGGIHGLKGFVAENLEAAESSSLGKVTYVIDDNHAADLVFLGKNGHKYYQQLKVGYHGKNQTFDFKKYRGQTLLVDKGNPNLARWRKEGKEFGVNVIESNITKQEAESLADWMKWETSLTKSSTATIIPKLASAHRAGMKAGAGKLLLKNAAVARTAAIEATNVAGNVVGQTAIGKSAILVGKSTFGAGAFAVNAVERFGTVAATQVVGSIGAAGGALGSMAVTATTGTAIGGAVASSVAAASFAGAAIGGAVIAAAPAVATVAAVGAVMSVGKKLWKKFF